MFCAYIFLIQHHNVAKNIMCLGNCIIIKKYLLSGLNLLVEVQDFVLL